MVTTNLFTDTRRPRRSIFRAIARVWHGFRDWRRENRDRAHYEQLPDYLLDDVGLPRRIPHNPYTTYY